MDPERGLMTELARPIRPPAVERESDRCATDEITELDRLGGTYSSLALPLSLLGADAGEACGESCHLSRPSDLRRLYWSSSIHIRVKSPVSVRASGCSLSRGILYLSVETRISSCLYTIPVADLNHFTPDASVQRSPPSNEAIDDPYTGRSSGAPTSERSGRSGFGDDERLSSLISASRVSETSGCSDLRGRFRGSSFSWRDRLARDVLRTRGRSSIIMPSSAASSSNISLSSSSIASKSSDSRSLSLNISSSSCSSWRP